MKYLLDTNVCIQYLRGKNLRLLNKISKINPEEMIIPSIVRYELYYGAHKSGNPESTLETLNRFLDCFSNLDFDKLSAVTAGKIRAELERQGQIIGPYDLLIAATAISQNLTLVSHNTREFSRIKDIQLEDWE